MSFHSCNLVCCYLACREARRSVGANLSCSSHLSSYFTLGHLVSSELMSCHILSPPITDREWNCTAKADARTTSLFVPCLGDEPVGRQARLTQRLGDCAVGTLSSGLVALRCHTFRPPSTQPIFATSPSCGRLGLYYSAFRNA